MLSHVTPWTAASQAPLSMDFSRQEYWSGLPFPSPKANFLTKGTDPKWGGLHGKEAFVQDAGCLGNVAREASNSQM